MRHIETCVNCGCSQRSIVYESTLAEAAVASETILPYEAHYRINRCANCGLLFSDPVLDQRLVVKLYEAAEETNVETGEETNVRRTMSGYYRLLQPHLKGRQRFLDVGCDMGFLLEAARHDGFATLHGIEPNPAARAIAGQIPGALILADFYENADYPPNHFDAVTLIHVLDHLFDPRVVLRRVWQHLAPGGVMMAVVHNVESLLGRVLKERFPVFNLYHHYFFSKATLAALARSCGFEVIAVVATQNCYSAGFFVDRIPVIPRAISRSTRRGLDAIGVGTTPIAIRMGNMGVIARRPAGSAAACERS